jgi:hypothetical protein
MYRDDWNAAVARAAALEAELRQQQQGTQQDAARIAQLTHQLNLARGELARLQAQAQQPQYQQPQYQQFQQQVPYGYMPVQQYQYAGRGGTVLTLGILSLVVCAVLGPVAWSMGSEELKRIDAGLTPPDGRGSAQGGQVCGIIGTVLLILGVVIFIFVMIAASQASHHHYDRY